MDDLKTYFEKAARLENAKTDIRRLSIRIKEDIKRIEGLCIREYIPFSKLGDKGNEVIKSFDSYCSKAIELIEEEKKRLREESRNKDKEYFLLTF